jgi:uncharacterized membrane protein YgcG
MKKAILRALPVIGLSLAFALPVAAHAEVVTNWHDDINVDRDGTVTVTETIIYDPENDSHHGIERIIPASFSGDGHTYYTHLSLISATGPIAFKQVDGTQLDVKIGDANQTISPGPHTYVISYRIAPLVLAADGHDRFIYNLVGNSWNTPIAQASLRLTYPANTKVLTSNCYTGPAGTTKSDCTVSSLGTTVTASTTQALQTGDAFTVDLTTPSGTVTTYLQPDIKPPLSIVQLLERYASLLSLVLVALAVVRRLWQRVRVYQRHHALTVVAEYAIPDALTPAELNMIDGYKQPKAIAATLIDLAVRGYMKIDLVSAKTLFSKANYRFTMLKTAAGLATHEANLFNVIFSSKNVIEMKELSSGAQSMAMTVAISGLSGDIAAALKAKGYMASSPNVNATLWALASVSFFGAIANLIGMTASSPNMAIIFALVGLLTAIGAVLVSFWPYGTTKLGDQEWAKIEGFKLFLTVTEKDRLAFTDAPAHTPELFSAFLPAAIALGVEKEWAGQFASMDVGQAVSGWYGGYSGALLATSFGSDFSSSFAGAVSSSFSGASGAGVAGGGGGGGGGGGW